MTSRLLVLSDIHSNFPALQAVLADAEKHGPYDMRLNPGDLVGYGPNPNECIQAIKEQEFITVLGNHERAVRGEDYDQFSELAQYAVQHNRRKLKPESKEYLDSLDSKPFVDPKGRFALVHGSFAGSPWRRDPILTRYEDIYIDNQWDAVFAMQALVFNDSEQHVTLGIFGHTHKPTYASAWIGYGDHHPITSGLDFHQHKPGRLDLETRIIEIEFGDKPSQTDENTLWKPKALFNPGSVGQPRHGSRAACYGIIGLDGEKIILEFRNVEYDISETQKRMEREYLPEQLIFRLITGL